MTEIALRLPFELSNIIYSYLGTHPVAQLVEDKLNENMISEFCIDCGFYLAGDEYDEGIWRTMLGRDYNCYDGMCVYCYAERLGTEVYTCFECNEKTFTFGKHTNRFNGLFCDTCITEIDENGFSEDEEYLNENIYLDEEDDE